MPTPAALRVHKHRAALRAKGPAVRANLGARHLPPRLYGWIAPPGGRVTQADRRDAETPEVM